MKYLFLFTLFFTPAFAYAENITSFTSDITLHTNGSFTVTETIEYDFGSADRHGIFRFVEKAHPQKATSVWKDRYLDIVIESVLMDGNTVPYEITEDSTEVKVKIGDPDSTITGLHTYEIVYGVTGGYSYFEDGSAEIYWNATGHQWGVPMESVRVVLRGEPNLFKETNSCYKGAYGDASACLVNAHDGFVTFTASSLSPYEGMTIAQELDGEQLQVIVLEKWKWWLMGLLGLPILFILSVFFGYRYKTAFKTHRPVIAQYEPYENFKPMYSGMLLDGRLDPHDITAGIVYLAEQGFIKIRKTERKAFFLFEVDDYELELVKPLSEIESPFLVDVAELIFESLDTVGTVVALSSLKKNTKKQMQNAKTLEKLRKDLKKDMKQNGFYEIKEQLKVALAVSAVSIFVIFFFVELLPVPVLIIISALIVWFGILGLFMYERRTRKGYEAHNHLEGFKLFLKATEKERYAFHNAPQKSPQQFMEYLPYAIAFGVEKQWAEVFKDLTIPSPSWYEGADTRGFSAVNLTSSLSAFSTAVASSSVSSASSSGGSGGGGFSGGGGGGGGGGSW